MGTFLSETGTTITSSLLTRRPGARNISPAIAAIDGVDALFMGVRDLRLSLGHDVLSADYDTPEIDAVVEKMIAGSKESGVALGIHAFSVEELQAWQQRGFHFLSYKTEYKMLIDQVQEGLAAARG